MGGANEELDERGGFVSPKKRREIGAKAAFLRRQRGFGGSPRDLLAADGSITGPFGEEMQLRINRLFSENYPNLRFGFNASGGADLEVLGRGWRHLGFKYGEIKPQSISGFNKFQEQTSNWNYRNDWGRPYQVRAITYDTQGNIFYGFF